MKYDVTNEEYVHVKKCFSYHAPKDDQPTRYVEIRDFAGSLATNIMMNCPPSRERSLALTALEECVMWANASIARNE